MASAVSEFLDLGLEFGPGLSPPTGQHPGGEHHPTAGPSGETVTTATADTPGAAPVTTEPNPTTIPTPTPYASTTAREG